MAASALPSARAEPGDPPPVESADDPYRGVSEASRRAALNTAEALYSLAHGIG